MRPLGHADETVYTDPFFIVFSTFFGCYFNDTVCCHRSVDRYGGRIFQYFDRRDIVYLYLAKQVVFGPYPINVIGLYSIRKRMGTDQGDPVQDYQRLVKVNILVTENRRGYASDKHVVRCSGLAAMLRYVQPRRLSL